MKNRDDIFRELILTKLFHAVGIDWPIDEIRKFVGTPDWFLEYSWTAEEEGEFREWLVAEVRKRKRVSKRVAENTVAWFMLDCGWKTANNQVEPEGASK